MDKYIKRPDGHFIRDRNGIIYYIGLEIAIVYDDSSIIRHGSVNNIEAWFKKLNNHLCSCGEEKCVSRYHVFNDIDLELFNEAVNDKEKAKLFLEISGLI